MYKNYLGLFINLNWWIITFFFFLFLILKLQNIDIIDIDISFYLKYKI